VQLYLSWLLMLSDHAMGSNAGRSAGIKYKYARAFFIAPPKVPAPPMRRHAGESVIDKTVPLSAQRWQR